jgi:hypothetical protein
MTHGIGRRHPVAFGAVPIQVRNDVCGIERVEEDATGKIKKAFTILLKTSQLLHCCSK